jgi:hypothetical protein
LTAAEPGPPKRCRKLFDRVLHVKTKRDAALIGSAFIARRAEIAQMTAILRVPWSEY